MPRTVQDYKLIIDYKLIWLNLYSAASRAQAELVLTGAI